MEVKIVRIPVTSYVYKFIGKHYGQSKFNINKFPKHGLRLGLTNMALTARLEPNPENNLTNQIYLNLDGDKQLQESYEQNKHWIKVGAFFQYEFNQYLLSYIKAQRDLATHAKMEEWNARIGLELFLNHLGLEEYEYSYESLRRQWTRLNSNDIPFFCKELSKKYVFCPCDNEYFKPAHLIYGKRPRIIFEAFSRSAQDIVRKEICAPQKKRENEADLLEWAGWVMDTINSQLRKGMSIE